MTASWLNDLFWAAGAPTDGAYVTVGAPAAALTAARALGVAAGQVTLSDGGAGASVTLGLATTGVTPDTYTLPTIKVDAYGRITVASSGSLAAANISTSGHSDFLSAVDNVESALVLLDGISGGDIPLDDATFEGHLLGVDDVQEMASVMDRTDWRGWTRVPTGWSWGGSYTISIDAPMHHILHEGVPLRVCSTTGIVVYSDAEVSNSYSVSGVADAVTEPTGRLYAKISDQGGGTYRIDLYTRWNSTDGYGGLVGHTAAYTTTGAQSIIADNNSGLSGTITINSVFAGAEVVEFFRWGVVEALTDDEITWSGTALGDTLEALWYGDASRCALISITTLEELTESATGVLEDEDRPYYWSGPPARPVRALFVAREASVDGILAHWSVTDRSGGGLPEQDLSAFEHVVGSTARTYSMAEERGRMTKGDKIDIIVGDGGGSVTGLYSELLLVLE